MERGMGGGAEGRNTGVSTTLSHTHTCGQAIIIDKHPDISIREPFHTENLRPREVLLSGEEREDDGGGQRGGAEGVGVFECVQLLLMPLLDCGRI